jgi:nicotinate dehydrogenase subunit B
MISHQIQFKRQELPHLKGLIWVVMKPLPAPSTITGQPPFIASDPSEGMEPLVLMWSDASVTALHGHVDMGTGLRTALVQIVADELRLEMGAVRVEMGSTSMAPNQGATIASNSIQTHAKPLRIAAAQIYQWALDQCAQRFGVLKTQIQYGVDGFTPIGEQTLQELSSAQSPNTPTPRVLKWSDLIGDQNICLELDLNTPTQDASQYQWVGQSVPRVDIPAKAKAELIFVHDVRIEGMLHGRVIRPPYAGIDSGEFVGKSLIGVDHDSVGHVPGLKAIVVVGDFIGVVCEREEHAEQAMRDLRVHWREWPGLGNLQDTASALSQHPYAERELIREGNTDEAYDSASISLSQTYVWPYQMHASIGPSCAVAQWFDDHQFQQTGLRMKVWAGTQNPHALRADLALIAGCESPSVEVIRMEASGCYGRNCADDVAADAALLSKAVGAPVRVQLSREQEHAWEPKGAAQVMKVKGALDEDLKPLAYDFLTSYPSNGAPTLALLLSGLVDPTAKVYEMGDRTANPPYEFPNLRVRVQDMAPLLRASWLRGVSALPNSFAHESFMDELALEAQMDPLAFRLRSLKDPRARELLEATAKKANWIVHTQAQQQVVDTSKGEWLKGQGLAYARYVHSKWPGFGAAYSAWIADVEVNPNTGEVHVSKVVVGHDAGMMINPMGVEHQVNGNVIQTTSRALKEEVQTHKDNGTVQSLEWGSYPILNFRQVPVIDILHMPRQSEPPLGAGESSSVPGTAAIANAIFDATGIRFRNPPFTAEKVLAALNPLSHEGAQQPNAPSSESVTAKGKKGFAGLSWFRKFRKNGSVLKPRVWGQTLVKLPLYAFNLLSGALACMFGFLLFGPQLNSSLISKPPSNMGMYGPQMLERGEQLAQLGNCEGCHTRENGLKNAGGVPIQTPFGTVYSTNISPDVQTGIGAWSFKAFERAMRQGVSADGHHLYPAFPYTSFKELSDEDMMSLYAWTMSQAPVKSQAVPNTLMYPMNVRGLMKIWNALFLSNDPPTEFKNDNDRFVRGENLVNGIGHCSACHTERNFLGAEKRSSAYLEGGLNGEWYAPALSLNNEAPIPWSEEELFRYLRTGHTQYHGVASGPMAEMIRSWSKLPDEDLLAMSTYLAQRMNPMSLKDQALKDLALLRVQASQTQEARGLGLTAGQRQFEGSCASCHHEGAGPGLLGTNSPLSLNTNIHSQSAQNLIQVILNGCPSPVSKTMGFMPAFKDNLNQAQIISLVEYIRARYAPEKPPWRDVELQVEKAISRSK